MLLVVAAGAWHAAGLATVNDDAFISFRYARQLVDGNGLVYNPGERVEGYTNFLWTVLIAGGMALGAEPVTLSIVLGIGFFAGTLLIACLVSRRIAGGNGRLGAVPLAALALVLHRDVNVYATSGLETSMQTFLVTALFASLALRSDLRGHLLAGVILAASMLTRPDSAVYGAAVAAFVLLERREMGRRLAAVFVPVAVLFVPYWILRWQYYGFFFPNAFYAKSIDLPYYTQGVAYAWMYLSAYYVILLVPIAVGAVALLSRRKRDAGGTGAAGVPGVGDHDRRILRLGILLAGFFLLFVVRIGGDFMFARFLVPVTPVVYLVLELLVRRTPSRPAQAALAVALIAGTLFRYDHFTRDRQVGYVADEWQMYPRSLLERTMANGAALKRYFDGLPVQAAFWGGQARLMYYAAPHRAIETMTGLTDAVIAHTPIAERGRPGHEKNASEEYLLRRGVDFHFRPVEAPPPGGPALNLVVFDSIGARIVCYRNPVMDGLRRYPEVRFHPMPEYLDGYIARLAGKDPADVARDYAWFREFYFRHNEDRAREAALRDFLEKAGFVIPGG